MAEAILIAGRRFVPAVTTTLDQDAYVMKRIREAGIDQVAKDFDPTTQDLNKFSERLLFSAFEKGLMYEILAGTLVEDNVIWTRDVAAANAKFFAGLTNKDDKERIYGGIATILVDFLLAAAHWSNASQKSSSVGTPQPTGDGSVPTEATSDSTTENGTALSETLPSTTSTSMPS